MLAYIWLSVVLGTFFTISGWRKSFIPATHSKVFGLFERYNVPRAAGWAVVLGEWLGGVGLLLPWPFLWYDHLLPFFPYALGLNALAALLLLPIMAGAIKLSVLPIQRKAWKASGAGFFQKVANLICTAEVMMTAALIALLLLAVEPFILG